MCEINEETKEMLKERMEEVNQGKVMSTRQLKCGLTGHVYEEYLEECQCCGYNPDTQSKGE